MAEWFDAITEFFVQLGYPGMFLAALAAGSIIPIGSEVVLVLLLPKMNPFWLILCASLGNTLGGMTCFWLGWLGKREWIHRYLGVSQEKLDKATRFLAGRGAAMAFFAFLPYIGEAIAVALGLMRSNQWLSAGAMFVGKVIRYVIIYLGWLGVINL